MVGGHIVFEGTILSSPTVTGDNFETWAGDDMAVEYRLRVTRVAYDVNCIAYLQHKNSFVFADSSC